MYVVGVLAPVIAFVLIVVVLLIIGAFTQGASVRRPAAVTVVALFGVAGGVSGLLCSLIDWWRIYLIVEGMGPDDGPDLYGHLVKTLDSYVHVNVAFAVVGMVLDVMLLAAGVGLFLRQKWARYACFGYGVVSLVMKLALIIYLLAFVNPIAAPYLAATLPPTKDPNEKEFVIFFMLHVSVIGSVVLAIFPVVVLVLMALPSVGRYLSGSGQDEEFRRVSDGFDRERERDGRRRSWEDDRDRRNWREDDRWRDDEHDRSRRRRGDY